MFASNSRIGRSLLPRPRLLRLLDGLWKAAVLTAPAGYGKSTLASQFVEGRRAVREVIQPASGPTGR